MKLYVWRHPKPKAVTGICYGQTDVRVDKRKIKRLANQVERYVKKHGLPKVIWVSHLSRSRLVGERLEQRGFKCHVDSQLAESHFGEWGGKPWTKISKSEIDNWCENFATFAPAGGESLTQFFERVTAWVDKQQLDKLQHSQLNFPILMVGHAGWISAAKLISAQRERLQSNQVIDDSVETKKTVIEVPQSAAEWPRSVGYSQLSVFNITD